MKNRVTQLALWLAFYFCYTTVQAYGSTPMSNQDSCTVNDICETATDIPFVFSDQGFICVLSCNTGATPELFNNSCLAGESPTTWFKIITDNAATIMNINVRSDDFKSPAVSLFLANNDCSNLQPIPLTSSKFPCIIGSNGRAEAVGTDIGANSVYYIAVSSLIGQSGGFELCISTVSVSSACVVDRDIEVTARSNGGPLTGPFVPGERVSICMNVNSYTAANNGCQWFQGLVPIFGKGWDPSSFDNDGQPLNATINGNQMDVPGNGLYGTSIWTWFADVDYHHDNLHLQTKAENGNGTFGLCNLLYEVDCFNSGGLQGGCCGPCWGSEIGTFLPPGWFAWGINGTCGTPGPPIRVDWGDGNTCGDSMGPWSFCFDLYVRDYPDCTEDASTRDLSLGFFTFADGETGAWTGAGSVCALDQPAKLTLPMACGIVVDLGGYSIDPICSGDSVQFTIEHPDVDDWTWSIFPTGFVQQPNLTGPNGFTINHLVSNQTGLPREITYSFTGRNDHNDDIVIEEVKFTVYPEIILELPTELILCERDTNVHVIDPLVVGGTGNYAYNWQPFGITTPVIEIQRPDPQGIILHVSDDIGCFAVDTMHIKTRPCHLVDTIPPLDEDNEPDNPKDAPPPILPFTIPTSSSLSTTMDAGELKTTHVNDTCNINDACTNAIFINALPTDSGFVCIQGCTNHALGEISSFGCDYLVYPTVWYRIETDSSAQYLNVQLRSGEMETPVVSVYAIGNGCDDLQLIQDCHLGVRGEIDAWGIPVIPLTSYIIAVSAANADTGQFELCLNTIADNNRCVVRRSIDVVSRSAGGSLEGPFLPGETVRVCMTVDSFTAEHNICEWFQGIVPVFGTGWSLESFESSGQPKNATINDSLMGVWGNGLYGAPIQGRYATWDWFSDVTYHYVRPFYKLGDFDNNGTMDLCNDRFDAYCQSTVGFLTEACCYPCRDDTMGTLIPPGWFSYGINGVCAEPAPPIRYDWGDGRNCGGGMGPWKICFDLQVADNANCNPGMPANDLSIIMFTFSDGEVGSGYGPSVCAFDQPEKIRLPLLCAPSVLLDEEVLPSICEGQSLHYQLQHPDVTRWTWYASPDEIIESSQVEANNGEFIEDVFTIESGTSVTVTYTFIGERAGNDTVFIKHVSFNVIPDISISMPDAIYVCAKETRPLIIRPVITGGDASSMEFSWGPVQGNADTLVLYPPFESTMIQFAAYDLAGCIRRDTVNIHLRPCLGGPEPPIEYNDDHTYEPPPPPDRNLQDDQQNIASRATGEIDFHIQPIPANDIVYFTLTKSLTKHDRIIISDMRGSPVRILRGDEFIGEKVRVNIDAWPPGLYTVTLIAGDVTISRKLVKL